MAICDTRSTRDILIEPGARYLRQPDTVRATRLVSVKIWRTLPTNADCRRRILEASRVAGVPSFDQPRHHLIGQVADLGRHGFDLFRGVGVPPAHRLSDHPQSAINRLIKFTVRGMFQLHRQMRLVEQSPRQYLPVRPR